MFVDTVHGETKMFGSANSLGNASFWINGGIYQPNCHSALLLCKYWTLISLEKLIYFAIFFSVTSICSHLSTVKYWAESVRSKNPNRFPAYNCENYDSFKRGACERSNPVFMGVYVDQSINGRFYLDTRLHWLNIKTDQKEINSIFYFVKFTLSRNLIYSMSFIAKFYLRDVKT